MTTPKDHSTHIPENPPTIVPEYTWSQTEDQVAIAFKVPEHVKSKDVKVTLENDTVICHIEGEKTPRLKV